LKKPQKSTSWKKVLLVRKPEGIDTCIKEIRVDISKSLWESEYPRWNTWRYLNCSLHIGQESRLIKSKLKQTNWISKFYLWTLRCDCPWRIDASRTLRHVCQASHQVNQSIIRKYSLLVLDVCIFFTKWWKSLVLLQWWAFLWDNLGKCEGLASIHSFLQKSFLVKCEMVSVSL